MEGKYFTKSGGTKKMRGMSSLGDIQNLPGQGLEKMIYLQSWPSLQSFEQEIGPESSELPSNLNYL